ncbi:double C2-like domain-containing protein beta [Sarotherodon galilaeus]
MLETVTPSRASPEAECQPPANSESLEAKTPAPATSPGNSTEQSQLSSPTESSSDQTNVLLSSSQCQHCQRSPVPAGSASVPAGGSEGPVQLSVPAVGSEGSIQPAAPPPTYSIVCGCHVVIWSCLIWSWSCHTATSDVDCLTLSVCGLVSAATFQVADWTPSPGWSASCIATAAFRTAGLQNYLVSVAGLLVGPLNLCTLDPGAIDLWPDTRGVARRREETAGSMKKRDREKVEMADSQRKEDEGMNVAASFGGPGIRSLRGPGPSKTEKAGSARLVKRDGLAF